MHPHQHPCALRQVRKAALRILWEACIRLPAFPRASEACVALLQRVADAEESIHELVSKVFHGLWFTSGRAGEHTLLYCTCNQLFTWQLLNLSLFCPSFNWQQH